MTEPDATPAAVPAPPGRIAPLDVLRAVAAMSVVWVHYWRYPHDNLVAVVPWLSELMMANDRLLQMVWPRGWSHPGVILFIVLSGFCIHLPQAGRPERAVDLAAFFRRRFFRIYPVYLFALGLGLVANAWLAPRGNMWVQPQPWSLGAVVPAILGGPAFWPWPLPLGNTILHTVLAEMGLYLIYPALLAVVRRWGWAPVLGVSAVVSVAATYYTQTTREEWAFTSTWGFLFFWWLGAFAAEQRARGRVLPAGRFWLWAAGLLGAHRVFNTWVRFPAMSLLTGPWVAERVGPRFEGAALINGPMFALLCMLLVWHVDHVRLGRSAVVALLVWIGERSYSLYAVHLPTMGLTLWLLRRTGPWPLWCWMTAPLAAAALMALACYYLVEAPGMRLGRKRAD
jgi:peptidoglycan/LPS O-acetylase OafA/YrhL